MARRIPEKRATGHRTSTPISIDFGDDASDAFPSVLATLCERTLAVSLLLQSGEHFTAVLGSTNGDVLVFEHWDEKVDLPNGVPDTVLVQNIAKITIY
jgi:hypothetical protein